MYNYFMMYCLHSSKLFFFFFHGAFLFVVNRLLSDPTHHVPYFLVFMPGLHPLSLRRKWICACL